MANQPFSSKNRADVYNRLTREELDLLVVGGGITGAGIALDAASRGMKIGLVEMQDFASGTSSRSTKLVHGGLRYLKQFEVQMVAEVGKERAIVYENGPHVTTPEWMLLPMHKGGTFGPFSTSIGLRVYDFLAGVKRSEWRTMLSAKETLAKEPLVKQQGLKGGGYYVEYRTDDARLTIEVMKEAVEHGARVVNYTKAEEIIYDAGKVVGMRVTDLLTGDVHEIRAKKVVNATGPWVDELREKDGSKVGKQLRLTKGVHVVIDQSKFPLKQAVYFDTPDGRMIFAIPRDGKAYVGTTDTFFDKDTAHPKFTVEDQDYVLDAIHYMFPEVKVTAEDVESSWAGVRPLIYEEGKDPSEISRKDEVWQSESGLITIAGGKLTGYRKMGEHVVDLVAKLLKKEENVAYARCSTKNMPMSGGHVGGAKGFAEFLKAQTATNGLTTEEVQFLAKRYGSNLPKVLEYAAAYDAATTALPRSVYAQLHYSIEHEMVARPIDFFIRRTGAVFFDIAWARTHKDAVIEEMKSVLNWTVEQTAAYTKELDIEIEDAAHALVTE
ncbi:glycerol-3-phosphate dehydrogenase/oxidase [Exiguobacterium acetylicum]|uniref:glycerol-3-phosphate dehydrogenase/oxidase n=1 Tax=Exiguobacterium acetylicum TaxID=41170 RepID=UPI000681F7E4|nr:FAD-dependent oxidoreductase [Exiguobacterium acetylicum]KNH37299.1 glycerol-3-phosphate dehydrogenase [Exiguobacterium acetylicum]